MVWMVLGHAWCVVLRCGDGRAYQLQSVSESEGAHVWVSHSAPTVSCPTRTAVENGYPENMQERENANAGPHSITSHFIPAVQIVNRKNVSTVANPETALSGKRIIVLCRLFAFILTGLEGMNSALIECSRSSPLFHIPHQPSSSPP
jgi:hypothetical protein